MGSLAMWSGLAGAGKGLADYSMKRIEDESYAKRSKIDEAREQRLADYKSKLSREEETHRLGGQISLEMLEQGRADMRAAEQDTKAMERVELQAQTQKDVADINQTGQTTRQAAELEARRTGEYFDPYKGAGASNRWDAIKMNRERYESKVLSPEEATDIIGITTKEQVTTTYDKLSGQWFYQVGDKLTMGEPLTTEELQKKFPQGMPKATPAQQKKLMANPDMYQEWINEFYYLPIGFLDARARLEDRKIAQQFSAGTSTRGAD